MTKSTGSPYTISEIPSFHPKLDLADLKENYKLYTDEEIRTIESLDFKESSRIKAKDLKIQGAKWDIVRLSHNENYAIYKGKDQWRIGKGTYGFIKLAQNLKTGALVALKIISDQKPMLKDDFEKEKNGLQVAKQFIFSQRRVVTKKSKVQEEILMEFASGKTLHEVVIDSRSMPTVSWLDICLSVVESVEALHKKNLLHNDLSLGNFILNFTTLKTTLVDYGLCRVLDEEKPNEVIDVPSMKWELNNPYYMAPECSEGKYSKKTDVYSVGILLALVLNLAKPPQHETDRLRLLSLDFSYYADFPCKIEPQGVRKKIREYVCKMLDENPARRPGISEVRDFFTAIRKDFLHLPGLLTRVAYLDLSLYNSLSVIHKRIMMSKLIKKDRVYLVHNNPINPKIFYLTIRKELEENSVIVMSEVICSNANDVSQAVSAHMKASNLSQNTRVCECFLVQGIVEKPLTTISELRQKVSTRLKYEVNRLNEKYKDNPNHRCRTRYINIAILALATAEDYVDLQNILNALQNNLLSKNSIIRFFQYYCGFYTTDTFKLVRELKSNLENDSVRLR